MFIKYHQNGIGNEYGSDGKLTDNWNPDIDYGNEYVKVHFRINTPTYTFQNGFTTKKEEESFYKESRNILKLFNILEDSGFKVENSNNKQAYLYIHPQDISGVIKKNDVKKLAEAFNKMETTSIRWVDLYKTVYVMTDAEYQKYLDKRKNEIRKLLFKRAATTRINKFYCAFDVAQDIANNVRLNRLGLNDGKNYGGGQTIDYILKCADEMILDGYLKCFNDNGQKYIRSLNKTEQKTFKPFIS